MSDRSHETITPIEHLIINAAPGMFVILWASGFIGAKLGLPYAEPLTFLFLRMIGAVLLLAALMLLARPKWPDRDGILDSCVTGVFMHAPLPRRRLRLNCKRHARSRFRTRGGTATPGHVYPRQSLAWRAGNIAAMGWSRPGDRWRLFRR